MKRVENISRSLLQSSLTGVWFFLIAYFAYHTFQGENSLARLQELKQHQQELTEIADEVAFKRTILEKRIGSMQASSIDPDMLETQVRENLGFLHSDEIVVFIDS